MSTHDESGNGGGGGCSVGVGGGGGGGGGGHPGVLAINDSEAVTPGQLYFQRLSLSASAL